jgi:hypothetical protein
LGRLKESFRKLMALPGNTQVLSGHGGATTIARERGANIFSQEFLSDF